MPWFDSLLAVWHTRCPQQGEVSVDLAAFRCLRELPGPKTPPAYQVGFVCPGCQEQHWALFPQPVLDLHPLTEPLPPHHDLLLGRQAWMAEGLSVAWAQAMERGAWPLRFACRHEDRLVGAWPSQLRRLQPAGGEFLVHYQCPSCQQPGYEQWRPERLSLRPPS